MRELLARRLSGPRRLWAATVPLVVLAFLVGRLSAPTPAAPSGAALDLGDGAGPEPASASPPPAPTADVPRNRTLVIGTWDEGELGPPELWNPYAPAASHQFGPGLLYEPLAYYSAFADREILWLAESYQYSADYRELTIRTRPGVRWSDGEPFGAADVAYTLNTLRDLGPRVKWGLDVQHMIDEATAVDPTTVAVRFKQPEPRFFYFLTYRFDLGIYIVPKHVFQGRDWTTFTHYGSASGWPVTTGPWQVVLSTPEERVLDRRGEWWAADAGLVALPEVRRIVYQPYFGEGRLAAELVSNQVDTALVQVASTMQGVLARNPKIITHVGRAPPYGYLDWWPTSLHVNTTRPPFDDPEIRWALSYFIDRPQLIKDVGGDAGGLHPLPFPDYPPLRPYVEAAQDLLEQYPTLEYDPTRGAAILTRKGWRRDRAGIWITPDGHRLKLDILGTRSLATLGPLVEAQLRRQGVDAIHVLPPDADERFARGEFTSRLYGHGGSVRDPFDTLRFYHGETIDAAGSHLVNFSRWSNPAFDRIVDAMEETPIEDRARVTELFREALAIWLPELPAIPLSQSYHRLPMNTTYWLGWPTAEDPYVNGGYLHLTFPLVLQRLRAAQ